jgi:hypothetical protein
MKWQQQNDNVKLIAESRREAWGELSPLLKAARKEHKLEIKERFLSKACTVAYD